jgi:hypothetical protein
MNHSIVEAVRRHAAERPEHPAVIASDGSLTSVSFGTGFGASPRIFRTRGFGRASAS